MGDSFWYLEDKSYSVILPCGISDTIDEDNYETITQTQTLLDDELDKFINGINTSNVRPKSTTWMQI